MYKTLTLAVLLLSTNLFSQEELVKNLIDNINIKYDYFKNVDINFNFKYENINQNIIEENKGSITISEEKYLVQISNQRIINNGETQWVYLEDVNEVQIMNNDPDNNMLSPQKIFESYEDKYKFLYLGETNRNDTTFIKVDLFPKQSNPFRKIQISVVKFNNELNQIILFDKEGGTLSYMIKKIGINNSLSDATFKFKPEEHKNIEIIDLRL